MLLYHFTGHMHLAAIMEEGLSKGEVPISDTRTLNAVNLTTSPNSRGHGLDRGGEIISKEVRRRWLGITGEMIPEGTRFANKRAVRITARLPSSDRRLERWLPWARKNLEPSYLERLVGASGGGMKAARTWWLYWGIIPPSAFVALDILEPEDAA